MNASSTTAIVLLAHGSTTSPDSGLHVRRLAVELARATPGVEVRCAFWKEQPALRETLATTAARDLVLVPVFAATGWFTRRVVPRELALHPDTGLQHRGPRRLALVEPVGTHPGLADLVVARLEQALATPALAGVDRHRVALVVAGHGTPRNPHSAATVCAHAQRIAARGELAAVRAAFLDQAPTLPDTVDALPDDLEHVVVVPCMITDGPHTRRDLPAALGIPEHRDGAVTSARRGARQLHYTSAVGTHPRFGADVLRATVDHGLARLRRPDSRPRAAPGDPWHDALTPERVATARQALLDAVARQGRVELGELVVDATPDGGWRVAHGADVDPGRRIERLDALVELATFTADGRYRALRTARDLARGWHVDVEQPARLFDVLEIVAPAAVALRAWPGLAPLPTTPWQTCAARHTGLLATMARRTRQEVEQGVATDCTRCTRHPTWFEPASAPGAIECPEPCPWLRGKGADRGPTT